MPSTHKQHMHGETENFNRWQPWQWVYFWFSLCCLLYYFTARQASDEVGAIPATGIQMYDDNKLQDVLEI